MYVALQIASALATLSEPFLPFTSEKLKKILNLKSNEYKVGCGNGRLTWHYAPLAAHVIGIDPDAARIRKAQQDVPLSLFNRVDFQTTSLQAYQPPHTFDLILFSWSL
jgi:2-polyprenyl-3-methyl-5-hydroxy-6-metoxy-1,4-benzoquinol methylase